MDFVIQHPGRVDLFDGGEGEYVPLSLAKRFPTEAEARPHLDRGETIIPAPEKQPTHPLFPSHT